jgi:hypothetical protein
MGAEPVGQPGTLHLLFSSGDRLKSRKATAAAGTAAHARRMPRPRT